MNNSSITLSGNQVHWELSLSEEASYLIDKFIWPASTLEGKDLHLGSNNDFAVFKNRGEALVKCQMQFPSTTPVAEAYGQAQAKQVEITTYLQAELKPFWDKRDAWQNSLTMTIKALGLVEEFQEGGES